MDRRRFLTALPLAVGLAGSAFSQGVSVEAVALGVAVLLFGQAARSGRDIVGRVRGVRRKPTVGLPDIESV